MFLLVLLSLVLLTIVFLLSKTFIKNLYLLFFLIGRSKFWALELTTLILLPGTIVHELSHLIFAEILRVKTGEISFTPQINEEDETHPSVRAASLKIASVDPFRRTLVGLAPLLSGLTIITLISKFYFLETISSLSIANFPSSIIPHQFSIIHFFVSCYLVFTISNTMFSSKKDLEAAILPAIIVSMVVAAFYLGGFSIKIKPQAQEAVKNIFIAINLSLGLVIFIDLIFLGFLKLIMLFFQKILHRKLFIKTT